MSGFPDFSLLYKPEKTPTPKEPIESNVLDRYLELVSYEGHRNKPPTNIVTTSVRHNKVCKA